MLVVCILNCAKFFLSIISFTLSFTLYQSCGIGFNIHFTQVREWSLITYPSWLVVWTGFSSFHLRASIHSCDDATYSRTWKQMDYPSWQPSACELSPSVVSDSLRPLGLWPARLLCPWGFSGKNSGVGCRFLLQNWQSREKGKFNPHLGLKL